MPLLLRLLAWLSRPPAPSDHEPEPYDTHRTIDCQKEPMTDWKKTPSTIVNFALAVLTAAAVALASLKGDGIEVPLWVVSAVTAGTVFLRALPPLGGEKKTDERGFVGIKLMLAISLLGLLLLASCRAPLTPADLECLAAVDIVEDIVLAKECAPLSGEAQDACIDRVSDRFDPLAESCGKDGAK